MPCLITRQRWLVTGREAATPWRLNPCGHSQAQVLLLAAAVESVSVNVLLAMNTNGHAKNGEKPNGFESLGVTRAAKYESSQSFQTEAD